MSVAYLNWGRWVVDCPCGSAFAIFGGPGVVTATCGALGCGTPLTIEWPAETEESPGEAAVSAAFGVTWRDVPSLMQRTYGPRWYVGQDLPTCSWRPGQRLPL